MIKIENVEVCGLEHAIRGMRNPMNSWDRSDSGYRCTIDNGACNNQCENYGCCRSVDDSKYLAGTNDLDLMKRLSNGGPVHAKYRRMITVYMDITAPLYWWKEFDTYKVGTVSNSCSTMHKIHEKEFTLEDFSCEHLLAEDIINGEDDIYNDEHSCVCTPLHVMAGVILDTLNYYRKKYLKTKEKKYWWQMIQLLPSSYNQRRTIMLNYEVLYNIYMSRRTHKLDEWREFCEFIVKELPYSVIFTCGAVECSKEV